jgi:peptide/nickel transport system substrate-binding protein
MKKRWPAVLILGTAVAVLLASATGAGGSHTKSGGTFRLATSSGIDSLNPYVAFNQDVYSTFEYIYPLLVQYDRANKNFVPDFARSWKASKDGKTWTFTTVAGAKWSDGKPLTAADAAWTINTDIKYQGGGAANAAGLIAHIKNATAPNPTTLVVHYTAAPGNVLGQFQQFAILPKHVWSKHTGHKGADLKTFPNNPPIVGAGPFKLVKYKKDQIALFERNNSFYGPKPQIDGFGLRTFSNDDAMVSALKAHEIDAIEAVPRPDQDPEGSGFTMPRFQVDQTDFIINSNPKKKKNRELLNLKLKEAFGHAIDRDQIIRVVFLGTAKPANSIIPQSTGAWHNPQLKTESFDLGLANKMLDQLGYKRGSGGIRVANGHKMAYDVIAPTSVQSVPRTFQIIQSSFSKIGVQLRRRRSMRRRRST